MEETIEGMARESSDIANDDELHSSASHGHIHTPQIAKEAYVAIIIATDEGYYYHVALLPLKAIDSVDGYQMPEGAEEWSALYERSQILHLSPVGRNEPYIYALIKETLLAYLFDVCP